MSAKKWNVIVIGSLIAVLMLLSGFTAFVDPFLHFSSGRAFFQYPLKDERYQNDGIARHYDYDSIITGTSMCQNFKCSEFNALWNAAAIKMQHRRKPFKLPGTL